MYHFNNPNNTENGKTQAGGDYYYSYGEGLFVVLNTNNYNVAEHQKTIEEAVKAYPDAKWRIVTIHQDIYGSGLDHSDTDGMILRTQLTPVFDANDIDVVLQGHDHTYSRSKMLYGDGQTHGKYEFSLNADGTDYDWDEKFLLKKAALVMPEAFLKNWLYTINEGKFTMEQIEKDFAQFVDMMRWNLIQKHFVSEMKLEVTPEEAKNEAKAMAAQQFAYYGMNQVNDETLENYAQSILGNKEENRKIYDRLFERKVIDAVTPQITVVEKEISADDFGKLAQEAQ